MTLKVKFANFELISRSRTVAGLIGSRGELELVTSNLLKTIFPTKKAARLLGVSISGFVDASPRFRFLCFNGNGVRQILRRRRLYFPEAAQQKDCRMAHVFVTGSADGLGKMAAELLIEQGHKVVLHARSAVRADEIRKTIAGAEEDIVVGDLASIAETRSVADQVNKLGRFDAVIHNAGIGYRESKLVKTVDGLPQLFAVNTLAPYILTALITMPKRLVYLSSGMHYGAGSQLDDMLWEKRRWNGSQAYAETKFQDVLLAFAVARLFPGVKSNSLEPGWVPTKMGGAGAPDDIDKAHRTQVWLATSDEPAATVSGRYFFHQKLRDPDPTTKNVERQSLLLDLCHTVSGTALPKS